MLELFSLFLIAAVLLAAVGLLVALGKLLLHLLALPFAVAGALLKGVLALVLVPVALVAAVFVVPALAAVATVVVPVLLVVALCVLPVLLLVACAAAFFGLLGAVFT